MSSPNVCVLTADGINCDAELSYAFEVAGGSPELVHINQLRSRQRRLGSYAVLAIPGGFSYGDDIASGKVLANELTAYLSEEIQDFTDAGRPVLGICNGFQVMIRAGLLPNRRLGEQHVTLTNNDTGRFECRWIDLAAGQSACRFVRSEDFESVQPIPMQVAHGEGKFVASASVLEEMNHRAQIVFRYTTPDLKPPAGFPENPNGSLEDIAGVCDPRGVILGMMPHPERSIAAFHPHRARTNAARSAAHLLFTNIIEYAKGL